MCRCWTPAHYVLDTPKLSYNLNTNEEKYVIQLSVEVYQCAAI